MGGRVSGWINENISISTQDKVEVGVEVCNNNNTNKLCLCWILNWLILCMNEANMYLCIQMWLMWVDVMLSNPSQKRRGYEQVKTSKISSSENMEENHPMVPPLNHFQAKNENCSSLARTISTSRISFFANLTTFEQRSGLKKTSLLKITIFEMGGLSTKMRST